MQQPGEVLTVEPCNICGDVGYPEAIAACCKCNINREHVYCMRINRTDVPDDWLCDSCQSKNGAASPCKVNQYIGLQTSKRQRAVTTGKVKFLHEEEVIRLSFCNSPMKPMPANSSLLMTRKASVGSKNVISKIFSQTPSVGSKNVISKIPSYTPKSNPGISMVLEKLPRNDVVHKNQMTDKHAFNSLSKGPAKEHRHVSQRRVGAVIPDKKVQTCDLQIEKPTEGAPCESLSARRSLPIVGSGDILGAAAECNRSNIEKSNLQSFQENFNLHRKYLPASIRAWRGRFQILQASGEFYDGFEAHPPCTVNRNAYKFSNKMPSVLQLVSFSAMNVLTDVFENDSPSLQDIALYFFPSDNTERSRKNLNSVLKFMNAENSMLRSFIDGVELLVFTSNHLNMDSRGTVAAVNAGCFLWGVFRQSRIDRAIERLPDMEPVDMDVDMIGGKDVVERIDHVRKDKPKSLSHWSLEGTLLQSTSRKVEEKTLITSSHLNLCVLDKSVLSEELRKKTKSELSSDPFSWNSVKEYSKYLDKLDVPPGFEVHAKRFSGKTAVNEEKPMVSGGRSVSNSACFVGLLGRGSVQPSKFKRLNDLN